MRFSMRTPVCTRSTSSLSSSIRTNVPWYTTRSQPSGYFFQEGVSGKSARSALFIIAIHFTQRTSLPLDENIYELRRQKLKQIEALGQPAYPYKYDFTHTIPQIWAEFDKPAEQLEASRVNVRVAGRIMAIRL